MGADFESDAKFNNVKFIDKADFHSTIFLGESGFAGTTFKKVSFSEAGFSKEANFRQVIFVDEAEFSDTIFCSGADYHRSIFSTEAYFSSIFKSETFFNYVRFENPNKITFESEDMSNVSFFDSDITKIRFGSKVKWGNEGFTIIEEKWLMDKLSNKPTEERNNDKGQSVNTELVLSVYRNLRENYEFRLRYGDAGKFFIKEMELKRKYREAPSASSVFKRKLIQLLKK